MSPRAPRLIGIFLIIASLNWVGSSTLLGQSPPQGAGSQAEPQTPPSAPAQVPPNASRITATVRNYSVWPPGSIHGTLPSVPLDKIHYSLLIEIRTAEPVRTDLRSLARRGIVIEAFASSVLEADLVGRNVRAILMLTGSTDGVRWWLSEVHAMP